jgi:hypothetical protein
MVPPALAPVAAKAQATAAAPRIAAMPPARRNAVDAVFILQAPLAQKDDCFDSVWIWPVELFVRQD